MAPEPEDAGRAEDDGAGVEQEQGNAQMQQMMQMLMATVQQLAQASGAPKRIVRGPDGRAVGVETVQPRSAMSLTLRRTKGSQLTWDEVDDNWTAGRTFDGTVLLGGEATAFDDLLMPLVQGKQGQVDKPAVGCDQSGLPVPAGDATQILYLNCQLPHRWLVGSSGLSACPLASGSGSSAGVQDRLSLDEIGEARAGGWQTYVMDQAGEAVSAAGPFTSCNSGAAGIDGTGFGHQQHPADQVVPGRQRVHGQCAGDHRSTSTSRSTVSAATANTRSKCWAISTLPRNTGPRATPMGWPMPAAARASSASDI